MSDAGLAVLDLGSTAIKVLAGDASLVRTRSFALDAFDAPRGWQAARLCALASSIDAAGGIHPRAAEAAAEVTRGIVRELDARGFGSAPRFAYATGALRDAVNAAEVLAGIEARAGLRVEVLAAGDEARLSLLGSARTIAGARDAVVVGIDHGGASTEIAVARIDADGNVALLDYVSAPLGTERVAADHPELTLARAFDEVRARAYAATRELARRAGEEPTIAIAGVQGLARLRSSRPRDAHGRGYAAADIAARLRDLYLGAPPYATQTLGELRGEARASRALSATVGSAVVLAVLDAFALPAATFSAAGLRYGLFVALAEGQTPAGVVT